MKSNPKAKRITAALAATGMISLGAYAVPVYAAQTSNPCSPAATMQKPSTTTKCPQANPCNPCSASMPGKSGCAQAVKKNPMATPGVAGQSSMSGGSQNPCAPCSPAGMK